MSVRLVTKRALTASELRAWPGAKIAGPGPYAIVPFRRFGKHYLMLTCRCARCERSRAVLAQTRRQLRRHHRRRKLSFEELLAASRASDPSCTRCGKVADHERCGLIVIDGRPDRMAHGRRVASGKRFARLAREAEAARARVAEPSP